MNRLVLAITLLITSLAMSAEPVIPDYIPVKLASHPALSPDGDLMAFTWNQDIWTVPIEGGIAKRFTHGQANELKPSFAPDGKRLAFASNRDGNWNIYVAHVTGGRAQKVTFHSDGEGLQEWSSDGASVFYLAQRDNPEIRGTRLFRKAVTGRTQEHLAFDAHAISATLSVDGTKILFTREGNDPYRPGYRGTKASQIWLYDMTDKSYRILLATDYNNHYQMWNASGDGFYCVSAKSGVPNLWSFSLDGKREKQLTFFEEDFVSHATISRDGKTIVFRHRFDFYRMDPEADKPPEKILIKCNSEVLPGDSSLKSVQKATAVTYSHDNLEIAFVAGGDLWVMDTILREPVRVVKSPDIVDDSLFSKDHKALYYILKDGIRANIFKATRADETKAWWENSEFETEQVSDFDDEASMLSMSRDGKTFIYCRGKGDIWAADADFSNHRKVLSNWNKPYYALSPDGKWLAYSLQDSHFNQDIWIAPVDRHRAPFNISRNPDWDGFPAWSPDGKVLSWCSKGIDKSQDIFYVYLSKDQALKSERDRKLEKARKAMKKRKRLPDINVPDKGLSVENGQKPDEPKKSKEPEESVKDVSAMQPSGADSKNNHKINIDFDGILRRVRRLSTPSVKESALLWSPDSKRIIFRNNQGKKGTYQVAFPGKPNPVLLSSTVGSWFKWDKRGTTLLGMEGGKPASLKGGKLSQTPFKCLMETSTKNDNRLLFNAIWRNMRDQFYKTDMNGCDWPKCYTKYLPIAENAPNTAVFQRAVKMMLGELNASHTGFRLKSSSSTKNTWKKVTAHSGLIFDPDFEGPGLKITSIVKYGPAHKHRKLLQAGDIVLEVNGTSVGNDVDWHDVMTGPPGQLLRLLVQGRKGTLNSVVVESISYPAIRRLRFKNKLIRVEEFVEAKSGGRFAYIHVESMYWASFEKFQKEIFSRGFGKDGLIIDVRNNGGGFTTDHLLTVLTQPRHAITAPRDGERSYPLDRSVYTYWHKPIVVICNQNSFSNTEVFCHAIKTLKRGKLVGVRTAGGVISTGSTSVLGKGVLRLPFRGWYTLDGNDMELNGATPDYPIWQQPGDAAKGIDRQLEKAIEVLSDEIKKKN